MTIEFLAEVWLNVRILIASVTKLRLFQRAVVALLSGILFNKHAAD